MLNSLIILSYIQSIIAHILLHFDLHVPRVILDVNWAVQFTVERSHNRSSGTLSLATALSLHSIVSSFFHFSPNRLINVQQSLPHLLTLLSFGCFPRPFYQVNELNGRRQPRLFVLLSDILIYATPRKRRPLRPGFSGLRERRKQARVTPRLTTVGRCRPLQDIHKVGAGQSSLYRHGTSHGVWFRRRMRRGFAYPPFERAWLDSVARPNPSQAHECPVDLLASRNVRFTCISVYPLHHCQIQPHFPLDSKQTDFVERSYSHLMFIDDKPVGRSSEHRTHLTCESHFPFNFRCLYRSVNVYLVKRIVPLPLCVS